MGVPVTVATGNAYYEFFMPMVIATRMRMPTVMGMPMTMCTGTYTIGKHAGGEQICPQPIKMVCMGGRFQNLVGTLYLTKIDARHKVLQLSDTRNHPN